MHIKSIRLQNFRRFTDLEISEIPDDTKLVVLTGPNGVGKSSVFDGIRTSQSPYVGSSADPVYLNKSDPGRAQTNTVSVVFDRNYVDQDDGRRGVYIRTAYRHEPDFQMMSINSPGRILDMPRPNRMIDQEASVSQNYQQLLGQTLNGLFTKLNDDLTVPQLRESLIGKIRESMNNVFDDLVLEGINDPFNNGTFFFEKGSSRGWPYKNLSGGEKAAFDILLDLIIKRESYNDTVFCIDEPETHLNTRVQGKLLAEMLRLLPDNCQLWIASHSIGMMREAWRMYENGEPVVFLDFANRDFDSYVRMSPVVPDRRFWLDMLSQAVGDIADLVAPKEVVLVEGRPRHGTSRDRGNVEFDARCLQAIFGDARPQAGFVSVGNSHDVENDRLALGEGIRSLVPGAQVIRLIDRDDRSDQEVAAIRSSMGGRVLSLRDIENYLFADDLLEKLCEKQNKAEQLPAVLSKKSELLVQSATDGNPADDIKAIAGPFYNYLRVALGIRQGGNNANAFLADTMAPLCTSETDTFQRLQTDIFGS